MKKVKKRVAHLRKPCNTSLVGIENGCKIYCNKPDTGEGCEDYCFRCRCNGLAFQRIPLTQQ